VNDRVNDRMNNRVGVTKVQTLRRGGVVLVAFSLAKISRIFPGRLLAIPFHHPSGYIFLRRFLKLYG
jgi:hypothetical protein